VVLLLYCFAYVSSLLAIASQAVELHASARLSAPPLLLPRRYHAPHTPTTLLTLLASSFPLSLHA